MGTAHRFNFFQIGAAINHPDKGKRIDVSQDVNATLGITDAKVVIQPNDGYGDPDLIRSLIEELNIDAVMMYTDPRQFIWMFNMEHEIRQKIPLFFYTVWDNVPNPTYNRSYYQGCDLLMCISKQTENIVNNVLGSDKRIITYIPHGINSKNHFPITELEQGIVREFDNNGVKELKNDYEGMIKYRKDIFGDKDYNFIILYNNRNIKRKSPGDVILAFKLFCDQLSKENAKKCVLIMHTQLVDPNGTDLPEVGNELCKDYDIIYYDARLPSFQLNYLYNISDVTINLASAEGFGLATAESLMSGTPILATVTGGLQDQMGFVDDEGNPIKFDKKWGSNHDGRFKKCGKWAFPLFPAARGLVGSPPTPYIF
ncbi:MAG TPA: hypothetical protein DC057_08700, partial [Spirochaetia bacterium]|nr:hypothetical protein [Spirochaetia bacterium]